MSSPIDETAGDATVDEVERLLLLVEASGKLLGSPTLDAVLPAVLDVAGRILAADAYALWLRDTTSDIWHLELAAGLSPAYQATATASVAQSPRTIALTDTFEVEDVQRPDWVTAPHREAYTSEGIRSLLALPLRVRDDVVGTLVFYYREPHRFQDSERRVGARRPNSSRVSRARPRNGASSSRPASCSRRRSTTRRPCAAWHSSQCRATPTGVRSTSSMTTGPSAASPSRTSTPRR